MMLSLGAKTKWFSLRMLPILSIELCGAVPADKALLSCVPHGVFGDILESMTSCSLGRHLQGWSRPSPQLFAKGGKGLSQEESALADYKIQRDSLPVYQDPILNHNDS